MSRKFVLLAAAVAFCGLSSVAFAQGGQGSGGTDQSANLTAPMAGAGASGMRARPMRAQRQARHQSHRTSAYHRSAMRGTGRAAPASNANAAYMGGGAVFERGADGSLRPVM